MTLLEQARAGIITDEMKVVAEKEGISPEFVRQGVADGTIVILHSPRPNINPVGVGRGMTTKVSASVGMYEDTDTIEGEMAKIEAAIAPKPIPLWIFLSADPLKKCGRRCSPPWTARWGPCPCTKPWPKPPKNTVPPWI